MKEKKPERDNTLGWLTILNSHMTHEKTHEYSHMYQVDIIKASPAQIPKHWSALIGFLCCTDTKETIFFQQMTNTYSFIYLFNFQSRVIFDGSIIQKLFN